MYPSMCFLLSQKYDTFFYHTLRRVILDEVCGKTKIFIEPYVYYGERKICSFDKEIRQNQVS